MWSTLPSTGTGLLAASPLGPALLSLPSAFFSELIQVRITEWSMFQLFTQVSLEVGTPQGDQGVHAECEGHVETATDHLSLELLPDGEQEHVFI